MIPPKITQLPPAPVRADAPVDFSSKADAMIGALQPFADEANILAEFVNTRAINANASASSVAGVQSAVSADRVLSQQAASNAAGSAAAALLSANNASGSATAAQSSANASEASAVRAENAAEYVENITEGAAPVNNPNFQGVVKVNDVPLGYAATAPTVGDGGEVMRAGAYGLGSYAMNLTPQQLENAVTAQFFATYEDPDFGYSAGVTLPYLSNMYATQILSNPTVSNPIIRVRNMVEGVWSQPVTLHHTGNLLNIGTTAATARTALNLFADESGVMTNGPGPLSNDMSAFLASATFDEMSSKVGGGGEIDFTTIATNASELTPQPGKSYWMNRNTASQLVTTLSCTHRPNKIRSWHMIVSKNAGAGDNFIPKFALTGLTQSFAAWSGSGVEPPIVSGVSHVMIAFTQIDQSVRAMVVDGW